MLVLQRTQHSEKNWIRCTVEPSDKPTVVDVCLVEIEGNRARIGINAPVEEVRIVRGELIAHDEPNGELPTAATADERHRDGLDVAA